jgi:hypothetical protein
MHPYDRDGKKLDIFAWSVILDTGSQTPERPLPAIPGRRAMAIDETSVKVRVVTLAGVLVGKMSKPKNIRTLDALNLKGDFFALTEAATEGDPQSRTSFLAINKRQVISMEEIG